MNPDSADQPTLADAYLLAHEIEFSEVNAIFKFLSTESVPLEDRSAFVIAQISQHQEKITSFNRTYGGRAWRCAILARGATAPRPVCGKDP